MRERERERCHDQSGMQGKARFTSDRARARASGHLFRDDSQMLDRSSRYNPTSRQTGMILNKGSHPVKHDRSSPRYVAVLLHAAVLSAFRRAFKPPGTNRPSLQHIKVRPDLQCYRESYIVSPVMLQMTARCAACQNFT